MFRSSASRPGHESDPSLERLSNGVRVLGERVDTLAQTVATTAAAIAKKDGELAVVRRDLESSRERVEAALVSTNRPGSEGLLRDLEARVAGLAAERARSSDESRLSRLEAKVAQLVERVDTLAATVAATAAGLAGRDGDLVALRRRLEQATGVPADSAIDEALRERIDDLGAATASASMRMESQATQIAVLRDSFEALAQRVGTAAEERAALATSIGDAAAAAWQKLDRMLGALAERVDAIERQCAAHDAALSRATTLWPAALRSLEARVESLATPTGAGAPTTSPTPETTGGGKRELGRSLEEVGTVEQQLQAADPDARRERAGFELRPQGLEPGRPPGPVVGPAPVGADVSPLRGTET